MPKLLTRDQFRTGTFAWTDNKCAVPGCGLAAVDAHHIVERALWLPDDPFPEGYVQDNGASLCERHHFHAENDALPPQALRKWLGFDTVLPRQLDRAALYDKWGQEIPRLPNHKYPSTPYLPLSPTVEADDATINPELLLQRPLVVTVKMDGSNVVLTREKASARNGDHADHPSFAPFKALHATFRDAIPEDVAVYGEWLFARHSIAYEGRLALPAYLMLFGACDLDTQLCWGWDEVAKLAKDMGLHTVPVVARLEHDAGWRLANDLYETFQQTVAEGHEGVVVRNAHPFHAGVFDLNAGKMVRINHNQCPPDWKRREIVRNHLG